ncbi:MAG: F0F1 ATP synthase subunit B [Planctomycetota bacterium]
MRLWRSLLTLVLTATLSAAIVAAPSAHADHHGTHLLAAANTDGDHDHGAGDHDAAGHGDDYAEGDGHSASKDPSPFDIFEADVMPYVWNFLMWLLLLGVLLKYVFPAILKGLRDREEKIRSDIDQAKAAREEAEAMKADFERQLAEARQESQQTIAQAKATASQAAEELKATAQREIDAQRTRAKAEIASAKEAALAEVYAAAATLATDAAGKILGRSINADDQRDLVEQTVNEFQANQN